MRKNSKSKKRQLLTFRQIMGWSLGVAFLVLAVLFFGQLQNLLKFLPSRASTEQRSVVVSSSEIFELGTFENVEAVADDADGRLQLVKNQAVSGGNTTAYDSGGEGQVKVTVAPPPAEVDFLFRINQGLDMGWPSNDGLGIEMNLTNRGIYDATIDFPNSLNRELILYKDSAVSQNEIWRYSDDMTHTEDAQQAILPSGMSFFDAQDSIVFIQETMATTGFLQALNVMRDLGRGTYFIKGEIGQYTSNAIMLNMVDAYAYADLIPTSVIFEPSTVTVGQPVRATVTIKNDSSVVSENSFLTDLTYQIFGNPNSRRTVTSERHVHLTANGTEVVEINFTAPILPGTYNWNLQTDIGGERKDILAGIHNDVLEAWEHNNYLMSTGEGGNGEPLIVVDEEPVDEYVTNGTYISHTLDLSTDIVSLDDFFKNEDLPVDTSLIYSFRSSNDASHWSDWTSNLADVPVQRYFQVKIDFATTDTTVTPALLDYEVKYTVAIEEEPQPEPNFNMGAGPAEIVQGETGTSEVLITPVDGFVGPVTLSVSGLPEGVGLIGFEPQPVNFVTGDDAKTSIMTLSVGENVPAEDYDLIVTATTETLPPLSDPMILTVLAKEEPPVEEEEGDFTITLNPEVLNLTAGEAGSATVTIGVINDFAETVNLSINGGVGGLEAALADNTITAGDSATLNITTEDFMNTQSVVLTVTGVAGALTHSDTLTVNVSRVGLGAKTFNLKISFEARTDYSTPLLVRIAPYNDPQNIIYATLVQTNSNGEVTIEDVGGLQSGVRYYVDVKSPIHLAGERDVDINTNHTYDLTFPELVIGDIAGVASYNVDFHDNAINVFDMTRMLADWFTSAQTLADLNLDNIVNSFDYRYLVKNWGHGAGRFTD